MNICVCVRGGRADERTCKRLRRCERRNGGISPYAHTEVCVYVWIGDTGVGAALERTRCSPSVSFVVHSVDLQQYTLRKTAQARLFFLHAVKYELLGPVLPE